MSTIRDPSGASGGANLSIDELPRIQTPEEAERYVEESATRYETEMAAVATALRQDRKAAQSHQNRALMYLGRAIAAAEVAYRLGLLDFPAFRAFHMRVTDKSPPEAVVKRLGKLNTTETAKAYVESLLNTLVDKRQAAVAKVGMSVPSLVQAYRLWLTHLGHTLESAGLLTRAGLLPPSAFEHYQSKALATLIPSRQDI